MGEGVSGNEVVADRMIAVNVDDGMNGGVGERITGKGDGVVTGVIIGRGITCPLHATKNKPSRETDRIFPIFILQYLFILQSLVACAPGEARTLNHWIRSPLLYPLSYGGREIIILEFSDLLHSRTHVIISPRAKKRIPTAEDL